jgi:hypothetical protein
MQDSTLFIHLVLQLHHFADAAVLWVALKEHADVREFRTSSTRMSSVELAEAIDRKTVQRSFARLEELGLINVRIHSKTATLITVNREAVLALLGTVLNVRLPGLDDGRAYPFLQAWEQDQRNRPAAGA